jgi:hypothetical protein
VDQLQFTNLPPTIVVQPQPASQNVLGGTNVTVTYTVTAYGTPPMIYYWRQNGSVVASGLNKTNLVLANVSRANSGTYSVFVFSPYGSVTSSNAVLVVRVPQLLATPALQPDGSILLYSADAGGGLLTPSALANFEAQVSTNLVDWVTLPNGLSLTKGTLQLQDTGQSNSPARFYRLVEH